MVISESVVCKRIQLFIMIQLQRLTVTYMLKVTHHFIDVDMVCFLSFLTFQLKYWQNVFAHIEFYVNDNISNVQIETGEVTLHLLIYANEMQHILP